MDLSSLSNASTTAISLSNLILVTPNQTVGYQPQNDPSYVRDTQNPLPSALLFNYEGEQTVALTSDITDHFIENNTVVNDQIALRPIIVTTHGFVGELNNIAPPELTVLKTIASKLTTIGAYTPSLSESAILAYDNALQTYNTVQAVKKAAVSAWSSINGGSQSGTSVINGSGIEAEKNQTEQQRYFQQFYGYWSNRTLFTIQTPWAIFQDMAIQSLRAIQDAETRMITDFEVTFKMLRFASTLNLALPLYDVNYYDGRAGSYGSTIQDSGTHTLQTSPTSFVGNLA
jgi:hypothetical protein